MEFRHMFLGTVTLAIPLDEADWMTLDPEQFVTVVDRHGDTTPARVRTLELLPKSIPVPLSHGNLNDLADEANEIAVSKGFVPLGEEVNIDQSLMLAVGELAEAQDELRHGHTTDEVYFCDEKPGPQGFVIEIADAIIRLLQLSARLDLDIDAAVRDKMAFNRQRPWKHGKQF